MAKTSILHGFGGSLRPIQKIVGPVVKEGGLGDVSEINHHNYF